MELNHINRRDAIKRTALLMGYAVSASAIASVMNGCKAEPPAGGLESWTPSFLNKSEGQLVARVTDVILPKTDTPGAIDAGVHAFIDVHLKDNASAEEQKLFKDGLAAFETSCQSAYSKSFLKCSNEEKTEMLKKEEARAWDKIQANADEKTFWFSIKELTLLGYFTSEAGSKQFLKYDPIPGDYKGCIPLEEVGGTWYIM